MTHRPPTPPVDPAIIAAALNHLESALAEVQQIDTQALPLDRTPCGPRLVIGEARGSLACALRLLRDLAM